MKKSVTNSSTDQLNIPSFSNCNYPLFKYDKNFAKKFKNEILEIKKNMAATFR